ncbi:MAG: hypothetical protein RL398_1170 [Planctomycetota bacterium]|jgi:hypothetical protein
MRRAAQSFALGCLTLGANGCGSNLLVQRRPLTLHDAEGGQTETVIALRVPDGIVQANVHEAPALGILIGTLCEPLDWLWSTGIAVYALGSDEVEVLGGPFGWLASLTPFATLVPALHIPPPSHASPTVEQRTGLLDVDPARRVAAAREFFADPYITAIDRR